MDSTAVKFPVFELDSLSQEGRLTLRDARRRLAQLDMRLTTRMMKAFACPLIQP